MIAILFLRMVEILLVPVSTLFAGIDSAIAPLLVMASSITFIFAAIQFPLFFWLFARFKSFVNFYLHFFNRFVAYRTCYFCNLVATVQNPCVWY